jgi:hypothetical protein
MLGCSPDGVSSQSIPYSATPSQIQWFAPLEGSSTTIVYTLTSG